MPSFTFTGPAGTYYPSLGLVCNPGDTQTFRSAPDDPWWSAPQSNAAKKSKAAATDATPDPTPGGPADTPSDAVPADESTSDTNAGS